MKRFLLALLAATCLGALPASAQTAPEIAFDAAANPLSLPDDIYLGEVGGVATNSKGDIFVYTRTGHPTISIGTARPFAHGGSRLLQFDRAGKFVREIGKDIYGFLFAQQVRIDPQDNIWVVDQMSNMVIKFDPEGRVVLLLGRKAEAVPVPARGQGAGGVAIPAPAAGQPAGVGAPTDLFSRPTDVAFDAAGNIYVADGVGNQRVAKFDKNGVFVKSWGSKGAEPGQFGTSARAIAVDAQGNVYVADSGNKRIQVFDSNGTVKTQITGSERHRRRRRDLQAETGRHRDRQVRQGRADREGIQLRQRHRLPQREQPLYRRNRQSESPEGFAALRESYSIGIACRVGKGALFARCAHLEPQRWARFALPTWSRKGGHASLCPPYGAFAAMAVNRAPHPSKNPRTACVNSPGWSRLEMWPAPSSST